MTTAPTPKTVLITGTSRGIGLATALAFHAAGWNVIATMRRPSAPHGLSEDDRMLVLPLDVQDPQSADAAVARSLERFGRIDALVNNAGYGAYGALEATPIDKAVRQFSVNVMGVLAVTKAVLAPMRRQRSGTIVNVSSIGGRLAFPLGSLYHASKFAVEGLSEALQYELTPFGIRVVVIAPGMVNTDFGGSSFDFSSDAALPEYDVIQHSLFEVMGAMMQQAATPASVAAAIVNACSAPSPELRQLVGADAEALLAMRQAMGDSAFFAQMRERFAIAAPTHA